MSELQEFRALLDRLSVDYHRERQYGNDSHALPGATDVIELGESVEFAFGADGQFIGWVEYVLDQEPSIHIRA